MVPVRFRYNRRSVPRTLRIPSLHRNHIRYGLRTSTARTYSNEHQKDLDLLWWHSGTYSPRDRIQHFRNSLPELDCLGHLLAVAGPTSHLQTIMIGMISSCMPQQPCIPGMNWKRAELGLMQDIISGGNTTLDNRLSCTEPAKSQSNLLSQAFWRNVFRHACAAGVLLSSA